MNPVLFLIPVIAAFIGWFTIWLLLNLLFHPLKPVKILWFSFQGILPKNQLQIAQRVGKIAAGYFLSSTIIEEKITDPATLQKILPFVDAHIDDFLKNKLKSSMPVISMFIGDKTIIQLKTAFMDELQSLFPLLMKNYVQELKTSLDIEKIIFTKISSVDLRNIETLFRKNLSPQLKTVQIFAAAVGFTAGIIQLLIILLA